MSKVVCELCGEETHVIQSHLKTAHAEGSAKPCTVSEYSEKFPDAPMLSEAAKKHLEAQKKAKGAEVATAKKKEAVGGGLKPLNEIFDLGRAKAARNPAGKPIMIQIPEQEGYDELVPDVDPSYVFPIDSLKTILMGMSMNIPVYLYGHAGTGKSSIFEQVAARTNRRIHRIQHTINTEESHIVGEKTVIKERDEKTGELISSIKFELGPLPTAMLNGHIFLADEFDRSLPSVLSVYQAVLEGKPLYIKEAPPELRVIRPRAGFSFVATGNTNGSGDETRLYGATMVQDAATFERFGICIYHDYMTKASETQVVRAQGGISQDDASKIVDFARRVREQHPQRISLTIGPRVLINIAKIGVGKGCFVKAIEIAFANRLPASEREAALEIGQRIFAA